MNDTPNNPQGGLDVKMKLYALYLKDLQTMGTRQEHARKYYITLISAIFTILSLGGTTLAFRVTPNLVWLVTIFGIMLCALWFAHMKSYRSLFKSKFKVLEKMEPDLPFQPFTDEKAAKKEPDSKHFEMTGIDVLIPLVFMFLFGALLFFKPAAQP